MIIQINRIKSLLMTFLVFLLVLCQGMAQEYLESFANNIQWFGQAAIKITTDNKIIYIDPYNIKKMDVADIILITHPHSDHPTRLLPRLQCGATYH